MENETRYCLFSKISFLEKSAIDLKTTWQLCPRRKPYDRHHFICAYNYNFDESKSTNGTQQVYPFVALLNFFFYLSLSLSHSRREAIRWGFVNKAYNAIGLIVYKLCKVSQNLMPLGHKRRSVSFTVCVLVMCCCCFFSRLSLLLLLHLVVVFFFFGAANRRLQKFQRKFRMQNSKT